MKSHTLRWGSLYRLLRWAEQGHRGVRVGIFTEDYPTLEDRQISKISREFPPWIGELKATKTDGLGFYLADEYGGGVMLLRNLDDPQKYIGGEFAGIGVDELTRNEKPTFDALRGSLRWPGIADTYFWGATNPLGIGLVWVRDLWIERRFPPEMRELAPQFHFIKALPTDNPHLSPEYWSELRSQPPHIYKAWVEGDWYVPVGVMFEELQQAVHRVAAGHPAPDSSIEITGDWGYEHPAVALWVETPAVRKPVLRVYREYVTHRTSPVTWAQEVVRRSGQERIRRVLLDSAAWNRAQDGAASPAEQMFDVFAQARIALQPVEKKGTSTAGSRVHGWQLLHEYFRLRDGKPLLTVAENCTTLWTQLTTLVRGEPPQDIEDTAPGQVDDAATALRYFVMMRPLPSTVKPEPVVPDDDSHPGFHETGVRIRRPMGLPSQGAARPSFIPGRGPWREVGDL
jgi:hypothetical protein